MKGYVRCGQLRVTVKPNSSRTIIRGLDEQTGLLHIDLKAPAEKDKANRELIRFVSKKLGKKVLIKSGKRSREKLLQVL